jgi:hypothetical protein
MKRKKTGERLLREAAETTEDTLAAAYSASGKRMMNPSRFGMRTLGNVSAFIVS